MIEEREKDIVKELSHLENKTNEINSQIFYLDQEKKALELKKQENEKQAKLEAKRDRACKREKELNKYEKIYSNCPYFLGQLKRFRFRWDAWVNAKSEPEILDYRTEMNLINEVDNQYAKCIGILQNELGHDVLGFRNDFMSWRKKIESRINKLEGGK